MAAPARNRGFLVVNPRAGDESPTPEELCAEATRRGVEAHVLRPGDDATELVRAAGAAVLGVAGGDGSLASVAQVAVERDTPFVCVPFGTRNHFARDAGIGRDPLHALDAFAEGTERRIDVGRVGRRLFLNNVSVGLYARLVHRRERRRLGRHALAMGRALALALRERHPVPMRVDGTRVDARILLVANNSYRLDLFSLGAREVLDGGLLHLYLAAGWLPGEWQERRASEFRVEVEGGRVRAALDGELVLLDSPLEFRIEPRALRLLVPPS